MGRETVMCVTTIYCEPFVAGNNDTPPPINITGKR